MMDDEFGQLADLKGYDADDWYAVEESATAGGPVFYWLEAVGGIIIILHYSTPYFFQQLLAHS